MSTKTENQSRHRQALETRVIRAGTFHETLGSLSGLLLGLSAIGGGVYIASLGYDLAGWAMVLTALGSLVGVFVYGRHKQEKDLQHKRGDLDQKLR